MLEVGGGKVLKIPAHEWASESWRQEHRGGTVADRTLSEVTVALPPLIADLQVAAPSRLVAQMEEAIREVAVVDQTHGRHLASLSAMLLRVESVASSKIERIEATVDDYARALHGSRANPSALSMVAATHALNSLINSVNGGQPLMLDSVLEAHRVLMVDDEWESNYAGRARDMQNWIGGSDYSPRGALFVPPPPRMVSDYLDDLLRFANRDDMPTIVQAAIVHAHFESIHPFTDGNGRIGRALINAVLRRRNITRQIVVPIASALVARRDDYFDSLTAYRRGDVEPLAFALTTAARIAAAEAQVTAHHIAGLPAQWADVVTAREGSAVAAILDGLLDNPVFSADEIRSRVGVSDTAAYAAIDRLAEEGIIRPLTARKRNQVWVASAIADELDDLNVRIAGKARTQLTRVGQPRVPSVL